MRDTLLRLIGRPLRSGVAWYLSRTRSYSYKNITIDVMPGVFHPGLFFSTKFLLGFLEAQDLGKKTFLELGCGSGLISVSAAKKGAVVTSSDISSIAVKNTIQNGQLNNVTLTVIHSDLFDELHHAAFDWIVINPPYYPANPGKEEDHAWYCGEHHEYFERLFAGLKKFTTRETRVLMVLSDVCDLQRIESIAAKNAFDLQKIEEKKIWADGKNYLYWIKQPV